MQFTFSLSLSVLLAILAALSAVDAAPTKRGAGMVTLPLKRLQQSRADVHPQVVSVCPTARVRGV